MLLLSIKYSLFEWETTFCFFFSYHFIFIFYENKYNLFLYFRSPFDLSFLLYIIVIKPHSKTKL